MKCFDHEKKEAVSVCKHCSKGLCKECGSHVVEGVRVCEDENCKIETQKLLKMNKLAYDSFYSKSIGRFLGFKLKGFLISLFFILFGLTMAHQTYEVHGFKNILSSYIIYLSPLLFVLLGILLLLVDFRTARRS